MSYTQPAAPAEHHHGHGVTSRRVGFGYQIRVGTRVVATARTSADRHLIADALAFARAWSSPT